MSLQSHDHVERIKHVRRPKKTPAERIRRQKAQKRRLVALGFPQAEADKLWAEGSLNAEAIEKILDEHWRTPYDTAK